MKIESLKKSVVEMAIISIERLNFATRSVKAYKCHLINLANKIWPSEKLLLKINCPIRDLHIFNFWVEFREI